MQVIERTSTDRTAVEDERIGKVLDQIRKHPEQSLTVEQMAKMARLARSTFHQRFLRCVGVQPQQYLLRAKLLKAKELLLQGNLPTQVVAELAGFQDIKWFYRAFKRDTGMAPVAWRDQQNSGRKQS
ncbi:MAG: AraC family transcriptional regulator [Verrucomicrobia bacterium]|nr:AraC family transcriptional regulator [Verrucomicrobiota bacterium]